MRLHHLQVQAFGPFAGIESVDFDALDAAGLYLIHGATGAGKTSILDAVCYAVYGAVPGSRTGHRDTIRSDHADPTVQPWAIIEFTAAGERLRIRRSPDWAAPKKRGGGTTRRPATVSLEVLHGADWIVQSTRMDEAAEIVTDHLGLGLEQFAQVVLLPQSQFATFLRAKPEDRATLLSRLFDIERFSNAQSWLTDRKRALVNQVRDADVAVGHQSDRLTDLLTELDFRDDPCERHGEQDADASTTADVVGPLHPAQLLSAISRSRRLAADHATRALVEADQCAQQRDVTRDAWQQGGHVVQLQRQAAEARSICDDYIAREPARQEAARVLQGARRAVTIGPVAARIRAAAEMLQAAEHALQACVTAVGSLIDTDRRLDSETQRTALAVATASGTAALAGLPDLESQRMVAAAASGQLRRELQTVAERRAGAAGRVVQLTGTIDQIDLELSALPADPDAVGVAEQAVRAAETALRTHASLSAALDAFSTADEVVSGARVAFAATERYAIELRQRRLSGIVGELAADLQDGCPCPVCGSVEHPTPASATDEAVSGDEVDSAEDAATRARSVLAEAQSEVAAARGRYEERAAAHLLALASAGHCDADQNPESAPDTDTLVATLTIARNECAVVTSLRAHRTTLATHRDTAAAALAGAQTDSSDAEMTAVALIARSQDSTDRLLDLDARAARLRDRHAADCWCAGAGAVDPMPRHARLEEAAADLRLAEGDHRVAADTSHRAVVDLAEVLHAHGFADLEVAEAAMLDDDRVQQIEEQTTAERAGYDRAVGLLEQRQIADAEKVAPPDVDELAQAARTADHRRTEAAQAASAADRGVRDLASIETAVRDVLAASQADRVELTVLGPLADTAAGQGQNVLRMRLTSYVLAARLEMVTTLANDHLRVMSDGRFTLEHSDELARSGARSGLGLRVLDAWTGRARDTASLSGGEAFIASLALALGLGDAVLQDTGGRPLESLFVDEGFGSLDEQTLDQVMTVLDGLRAGGRSVGIVSHVAELRHRIRSRVEVTKTETGSHVMVHAHHQAQHVSA